MPKPQKPSPAVKDPSKTMGLSPEAQMNKNPNIKSSWCPRYDVEYDEFCDPFNPRAMTHKDIFKALPEIRGQIAKTPLIRSKYSNKLGVEVFMKLETLHKTGSCKERGAFYALHCLSPEQRERGVVTASLGNFGMALAYYAHQLNIKARIVYPIDTPLTFVNTCKEYGARVFMSGETFNESKHEAFVLAVDLGSIYINGYDHPDVIAGSGTIALEILEDMPDVNAILVPVGGGALIAGIAAAAKHINPKILIYGIEPSRCCCFFKAMENDGIFDTDISRSVATRGLGIPMAGCNAFHTAKSLIDKMVIVDDDWISRAVLHFVEEEKMIVDGAGATGFSALLAIPDILPELQGKTVVCVMSGSNIDIVTLPRCLARAKAIEGRLVNLTVKILADCPREQTHVMSMIANTGCNVLMCRTDHAWIYENDLEREDEDFDEFCDPDNPRQIKYDDVVDAALEINPHIVRSPCLPSHYQRKFAISLFYKLENMQRSGSFKERGAVNALLKLPLDKKKLGVVVASLGNEGIGMSYHGSRLGIPVIVVMPITVPISELSKCHNFGAKVIVQGINLAEAQRYARAIARDKGLTYINGRDHPDVLNGYGTIALEILQDFPNLDAVIVPVGTGGLAAAVATVIKNKKPDCLVYGVQPENSPYYFKTLEIDSPDEPLVVYKPTMASAIDVTCVGTNSYSNAHPLLDKMLLVKEDWIARAMLHMFEKQRLVVEGAAACPLAAVLGSLVPEFKLKNVVAIVTGGNPNLINFNRCMERGLSAEGRLVKFTIKLQDSVYAQNQLFKLLTQGGYNLEHSFQIHRWTEDTTYNAEVCLACRCKNLEHALELKRIIERAYPNGVTFETEPFNDKRTCPCYVYKNVCAY